MLALALALESSRNWLAYLRPAFHLPEFRNSHFSSNLLFSLGIHFERDQLFSEQGSGAIFYIFRAGIFPVKQKDEKLQIRIWLGGTEENSQVQTCCCSPKRLATKIQGDFSDANNGLPKTGAEKKPGQPHNKQIAYWEPQRSMSWLAKSTKRGSPTPGTGSCSSLGPAPTLTQLSQGLDQGYH